MYFLPLIIDYYTEDMVLYLGVDKLEDIEGRLYLSINKDKELTGVKNIEGETIINNKRVYIIKIDENLIPDYHNFLIGNYSKINNKSKILTFWVKKNNKVFNRIKGMMLFQDSIKDIYFNALRDNDKYRNDEKELEKALRELEEVEDIPKLEDEILFNTDIYD